MNRRWIPLLALVLAACSETTAPPSHSVVLTPETAEVFAGESQQFTAEVLPAGSNQTVQWLVAGPGTISATGLYQAPEFTGNVIDDEHVTISASSPTHGVSATAQVTIPAAASLTLKGWQAFAAGDLSTARTWFDRARNTYADYPPALAGYAWIDYREGHVEDAVAAWGIAADMGSTDAMAGLLLVHAAAHEAGAIIDRGRDILNSDSDYVFAGDPEYSASDIRWLMARAALDTGQYDVAAAQLNVLVPGNQLNPQAASFLEDALLLLESIQGIV